MFYTSFVYAAFVVFLRGILEFGFDPLLQGVCVFEGYVDKAYIGQTSRNLTIRYRKHIRYIKNNDPQSAYALHILKNRHGYSPLKDTMTLLKPIHKPSMLIPYEQLLIQTFHQNRTLIPEQNCSEQNPLFY
jgi:hypothetical protein